MAITKENFRNLLRALDFDEKTNVFSKHFAETDAYLKADFKDEKLIYPTDKGFTISGEFTTSFSQKENFVVFECVYQLFKKGYKPQHIELEPKWTVGHGASGGRADIMVKDNSGKSMLIIECKTAGKEFEDEWKKTKINGGQIFTYAKQAGSTKFIALYTSDFIDNQVKSSYYLITLIDNERLLKELSEKNPLSYEKAKPLDKEDIYQAWKDTYALDFATKGIFEKDIPAYEIGKTKYSLPDLSIISSNDIQGKYHQFATILRQHNVSGRENAFDKLVNLFLCKIVDETNNPDELKFYWKGIAYDNFFDLTDRLQKLYQVGMQKFLGEDVVYISSNQIEDAFRHFRNDPDSTRETIKKYFKELKFFNNNEFGFIDVHNEKLFYQNAAVLLKIVQMLQDIKLKSGGDNHQFLGDMFEGFLDQGVKQSEGQFFTPIPIVKFILKSLPLETIILSSDEIPKTIDYACGAGHFLNEYAKEIKPIVEKKKKAVIEDYYENVFGIEKEYRLSKVAKVSAFMYGQDDINIIFADALANIPDIKENDFSVLVANPPYSVKGFLETLGISELNKYQLIDTVDTKSYPNNNSIETFFIERAKQLLKPDGVAGIIVPTSILTKGKAKSTSKSTNIYVAIREILIKYFDIVAIAEFGSGTFGKTGTNTVTLFLRRKKENPAPADHYKNRIEAWFNGDKTKDGVFEDELLIKKYCNHLELNFEDYQTLLTGKPNENILESDIFKEYKKEFDKWTEIKNLKNQKTFKSLNVIEQNNELEKRFISYLCEVEKDKLYYFVLSNLNPQKVIVIKSPKKNKIKKFLGYEWSSAKGNEGIKYLGEALIDIIDENIDDEVENLELEGDEEGNVIIEKNDKRILSNIFNLNNINTPLYDPKNKDNKEKINYLIGQNFKGLDFIIPDSLLSFVKKIELINLLDFSRPDFNKSISLSAKSNVNIETKWELKRIEDIASAILSGSRPVGGVGNIESGILSLGGEHIHNSNGFLNLKQPKFVPESFYHSATNGKINKNDILICKDGALTGKIALVRDELNDIPAMVNEHLFIIRCSDINNQIYLFNFLFSELGQELLNINITGAAQGGLNSSNLKNIKIPFPPMEVQKQIIVACQAIDKEFEKAEKTIVSEKDKIEKLISNLSKQGYPLKKVSDLSEVNPSKTEIKNFDENKFVSFIEMASVSEEGYITNKEDRMLKNVKTGSYRYFKNGDIIIAKITPCMENGKCAIANDLTNGIGFGSSEFHVFRVNEEIVTNKFLFAFLNREVIRQDAEKNMTGSSGHRRVPDMFYKNLQIPVPINKKTQNKLVSEIEKSLNKIKQAQLLINEISKSKEDIIKKYL